MSSRSVVRKWDRVAILAVSFNRHVVQPALGFLTWPFRRIFTLVGWLSLGLVGWALIEKLRSDAPDLKWIAGLAALALVCGLVAQLGGDLIPRIKKLGPLELFEEQASGLLAVLDGEQIGRLTQAQPRNVEVLTAEQRFAYEQADFFISLMEFNRIDLSKDGGRRGRLYRDLLWAVIGTAFSLRDFPRTLSRLEICRRFQYPPETLDFYEGQAHYFWSLTFDQQKKKEENEKRERHLEKAFLCFSLASRRRKDSHKAYTFLALVCSARGDHGLAIHYTGRALAIRPQLAPARYNRASALVQIGRLKKALASLKKIERTDEEIEKVRAAVRDDPELAALRNHSLYGAELRQIYLKLGGKAESWDQPRAESPGQA